jgi:hypothetical protein
MMRSGMWWGNIEMFFDDVFVNANFSAAVTLRLALQFFAKRTSSPTSSLNNDSQETHQYATLRFE